jgi:NADH-quinone oxidoreductase subunit L
MNFETLLLLVLALPLLGGFINGAFGKHLSEKWIGFIATFFVVSPFIIATFLFMNLKEASHLVLFNMIELTDFKINASLHLDSLSIWMTMIITGIGSLIHVFSIGYMKGDEGFYKFFSYLNLFIFSMLLLVLGGNYFMLLFGWEGVGICSYLLIGFHYSDKLKGKANSIAARKAFTMNRIGDLGLIFACFLFISHFKSLEFDVIADVFSTMSIEKDSQFIIGLTLSLFLAATGKSAQIPLFTWLPDAMAGPTPVSALIHAATMVTAGIYLIIRSNFLFELAPFTKDVILFIGIATSLITAFIALRQNDIKKVLAYSTVSQLGLMFVALGLGSYTVALFHVTTHAFFKALLFLGSGSIIHANHHEQDITKMGGLRKYMPITKTVFLIGTLAISGFPLLSGFFSKDEILASALHENTVIFGLLILSAALTAVYMFRLYFLVFHGEFRGSNETKEHLHESGSIMTIPLIVLAVLSVFGGILNLPGLFFHGSAHWMSSFLEGSTYGLSSIEPHHLDFMSSIGLMVGTSALTLLIIGFSYNKYVRNKKTTPSEHDYKGWEMISSRKLYFDEVYNTVFVKPVEWLSRTFAVFVDNQIIDAGVDKFAKMISFTGVQLKKIQTGVLSNYLLSMMIGIILLIGYCLIYFKFWNY